MDKITDVCTMIRQVDEIYGSSELPGFPQSLAAANYIILAAEHEFTPELYGFKKVISRDYGTRWENAKMDYFIKYKLEFVFTSGFPHAYRITLPFWPSQLLGDQIMENMGYTKV